MSKIDLIHDEVSDFFWFDHSDQLLHYRLPGDCPFPGLLRKIKKAITDIKLLAHRYFAFHMGLIQYSTFTVDEAYLTRTHINSSSIAIQPFLTSILVIADKFLPFCSNHSIRHQILRHTATTFHGHFYNPSIPSRGWIQFVRNPMAPPARNLWYRLLQRKLSNKSSLAMIPGIVDSDRCVFCNEVETAEHLLFSCAHKKDIWSSILSIYLTNSSLFSLHQIFTDISSLSLDSYLFSPSVPSISIIDLFSVTMYQVWKAHWRHHFDAAPFIPSRVLPLIHKDLQILIKNFSL